MSFMVIVLREWRGEYPRKIVSDVITGSICINGMIEMQKNGLIGGHGAVPDISKSGILCFQIKSDHDGIDLDMHLE